MQLVDVLESRLSSSATTFSAAMRGAMTETVLVLFSTLRWSLGSSIVLEIFCTADLETTGGD